MCAAAPPSISGQKRPIRQGITLATVPPHSEEVGMLWIMVVAFAGLGFAYVTIRRKRKTAK